MDYFDTSKRAKHTLNICLVLMLSFYGSVSTFQLNAQVGKSYLRGSVIDSSTSKPIPFVNIGIVGKGVGTVTDSDGNFEFSFNSANINASERIQFSIIGFETESFSATSLAQKLKNDRTIVLTPEPYGLQEVVVSNVKRVNKEIGNSRIDEFDFGYWKNQQGLGGEIASKIRIRNERTQLKSLKFKVLENRSDSIRVRVNIYDIDPIFRTPQNNILKEPIYHTISRSEGFESIPLRAQNIMVDQDIIVSIELVEIYGSNLGFAVAGSFNKNPSYTRPVSQAYWTAHKQKAIGFTLDVSYPSKKEAVENLERASPEGITIYWDASAKAKKRNLALEKELLVRYLKKLKNVEVTVQKFAIGINERQVFSIKKGRTEALISYLDKIAYDGTSDYSELSEEVPINLTYNLVFTDGNALFSDLEPIFNNTTFTIASLDSYNKNRLEELALYTEGSFIDLNETRPKDAIAYLLESKPFEDSSRKTEPFNVEGVVESDLGPLEGARVGVNGSFREVVTNSNGLFDIEVYKDESLVIQFAGMKTKRVAILNDRNITVKLEATGDWLNEVILTGKNKKEDKNLVETARGKKNFDAVTFKTNIITEKDIAPSFLTLGDIIKRISNLRVEQDPFTTEEVYINPRAVSLLLNVKPIVVVDGIVYEQTEGRGVPPIDPQNIISVEVITSLQANALYGTLGRGGAIIVKTKTSNFQYFTSEKEKQDSALIKGNDYDGSEVVVLDPNSNKPFYLLELENANSKKEALSMYHSYKTTALENSIAFYIDSAVYFEKWDKNLAIRIVSNLPEYFPGNIEVLKLMAIHLEKFEKFNMANGLYERILEFAPNRIQSYRDLANSSVQVGKYSEGFELYKTILANETKGLDFEPLKKTAEFELMRLLAFHKSKVSYQDLPNSMLGVGFKKDRRLLFEWTNPQADFKIQFVNPQAKYFEWEHSIYADQKRLQDELEKGYSMEEFALDEAPPGEWLINVQYLGNQDEQPPVYLKYTLFKNYATPQETKEVRIIKLYNQTKKVTVGTIKI